MADDHHEGAEVGLAQQQAADHQHHHRHRQEAALEAAHVGELAHRVVGGVEHGEELHQLGGLKVDRPERQPAPRAVDLAADARNQHDHQQDDAER